MATDNKAVARIWAQNNHDTESRSHNGNLSAYGPVLFSYQEPIARHYHGVVLIRSEQFSKTTARHISMARFATRSRAQAIVPHLGADSRSRDCRDLTAGEHAANLSYLIEVYGDAFDKASRSRRYRDLCLQDIHAADRTKRLYAETFDVPTTFGDTAQDIATITAHWARVDAR